MIKLQETETASEVLKSLEELAAQAKAVASNLAYAALKSREAGNISTRVYEDVLDLVDHTGRITGDLTRMVRVVKMEVGRLYKLTRHGEIEMEKNRELIEKIERSLDMVLAESQRVLENVKRMKSVSANNKLIS
jgi:predicted fused transcriptional regulator/phosphomethylpyrimidine kinase